MRLFFLTRFAIADMWHGRRAIMLDEPSARGDFGFLLFFIPFTLAVDVILLPLYVLGSAVWWLACLPLRRRVSRELREKRIADLEREVGI